MEDYAGPDGAGFLVGEIENQTENKKRDDGLQLKRDGSEKQGGEYASEPNRPGFGEDAVNESAKKEFFQKGGNNYDNDEGADETEGIVAEGREIGLLILEAGQFKTDGT